MGGPDLLFASVGPRPRTASLMQGERCSTSPGSGGPMRVPAVRALDNRIRRVAALCLLPSVVLSLCHELLPPYFLRKLFACSPALLL